jgi:hypothetical protein
VATYNWYAFVSCTEEPGKLGKNCFKITLQLPHKGEDQIDDPDSQQRVFQIKMSIYCHHQKWFRLIQEGNDKRKKIKYISTPDISERTRFPKPHPFRVVGKFLLKTISLPLHLRTYYTEHWYSKSHQHKLRAVADKTTSLDEMLNNLSGKTWVYFNSTDEEPGVYLKGKSCLRCHSRDVVALIWIPPWTITTFQKCNYIELDTSFHALRPYVYSVPLAIHANESFPLALIIGLVESIKLYRLFIDAMSCIGIPEELLFTKPFLTDQHKALISVCEQGIHFKCLRHLIENFGSNSFIGQIVRRLAFSSTVEDFEYQAVMSQFDIGALERNNMEFNHK